MGKRSVAAVSWSIELLKKMIESQKIEKPWGHEEIWAKTDSYVGKILVINKGNRLSLQYHNKKEETIRILSGKMTFHFGNAENNVKEILLNPGDTFHIKPGLIHRFEAKDDDVVLVEVSTTELDDVVRLKDDYNRA